MPEAPQVRPATVADLDAAIGFAASIPEAPAWPRAAWESYLADAAPPRRIFLAESDGELTGFIAGQIVADACELDSIAVASNHRRSGIGSALLTALIGWAEASGASHVQLEVRAGNISAIEFYARSGFRRDGLRPAYYRNPPDDALLMGYLLCPSLGLNPSLRKHFHRQR